MFFPSLPKRKNF